MSHAFSPHTDSISKRLWCCQTPLPLLSSPVSTASRVYRVYIHEYWHTWSCARPTCVPRFDRIRPPSVCSASTAATGRLWAGTGGRVCVSVSVCGVYVRPGGAGVQWWLSVRIGRCCLWRWLRTLSPCTARARPSNRPARLGWLLQWVQLRSVSLPDSRGQGYGRTALWGSFPLAGDRADSRGLLSLLKNCPALRSGLSIPQKLPTLLQNPTTGNFRDHNLLE